MKVVDKGLAAWRKVKCRQPQCRAVLEIDDTDVEIRYSGGGYGGDVPERVFGVVCGVCKEFITLTNLPEGVTAPVIEAKDAAERRREAGNQGEK
jgi:hypothetical protein